MGDKIQCPKCGGDRISGSFLNVTADSYLLDPEDPFDPHDADLIEGRSESMGSVGFGGTELQCEDCGFTGWAREFGREAPASLFDAATEAEAASRRCRKAQSAYADWVREGGSPFRAMDVMEEALFYAAACLDKVADLPEIG